MNADVASLIAPLSLSWNLRNAMDSPSMLFPGQFSFEGIGRGEYPIDAWRPFPLEVPAGGTKTDISGRMNHAFGVAFNGPGWNWLRTVNLPIYHNGDSLDMGELATIIRHWPKAAMDDLPCISLAVKRRGWYGEDRETQSVTVLVVWGDSASRIVTLDWSEGQLEDCVTPEWCIHASPLMDVRHACAEMGHAILGVSWDRPRYSMFILPTCLGRNLHGVSVDAPYKFWKREWIYENHSALKMDLCRLLSEIVQLFGIGPSDGSESASNGGIPNDEQGIVEEA